MRIAIAGLTGAGKKTLFDTLTSRKVSAMRKAGEAVEGVAYVADKRVDVIAGIVKPKRVRYAESTVVLCPDIGLEGAGEAWRDAAHRCELLCLVVRAFSDENVFHPAGSVDATRDRRNLQTELLLADLEMIEKRLTRITKEKRGGQSPQEAVEEKTLDRCKQWIEGQREIRKLELARHEVEAVRSFGFLTLKPVLWAVNVGEDGITQQQDDGDTVQVCCKLEEEIAAVENAAERQELLQVAGLDCSGVETLHKTAYRLMNYITFYTIVSDEVRAWTVQKGSTAPVAAGKVHTDMERGFIRAEVIKYDDLVEAGNVAAVKQHGKAQVRGKDYIVEDGDICSFRFNV